ncbi:DMT family transporter [Deinococcus puniceus]|uniref:Membrane protein n=1 Tax=Deinococcus puniceus TaxID=1182568 RepID=A0A172T6N6_9DEIO|nr:DMT family transporter [Deinococcus puniceus]ANE42689.1 membrane protein [Deinococcus puniceus]
MSVLPPARPAVALDSLSLAAILVTIVFWASSFAGIRAGLEAFSPGHLTLYRFLVASAALGTFALVTRIPLPPLSDLGRIALLSFSGITLYHICLNYGEVSVPAGTASLIIAAGPVITALLATRFGNERLNLVGWIGTLISFSGVALIVLGKGESVNFTQGALLILAAALFTSLYFVFQKPLLARMKPLHFTVWSLMLGTLPMLIFLPGFGSELARAPLAAHLAVIYIGLFPAALAYITWSFALSRVGANTTASFLYVSPVLAILIGWLWLNEVPGVISLVGGAISIAGVILVNTLGKPRKV